MKTYISLSLILFMVGVVSVRHSQAELCPEGYDEEIFASLEDVPWESMTHSHDTFGEHTHDKWIKQIERPAGCLYMKFAAHDHPEVEPEPEPPPVIEGYVPPIVLTCVEGPCLEKENPNQVLGPLDLEGNKPPESEPGEQIYYPTVIVDGVAYWDSSRPSYTVPEKLVDTEEVPAGYKLEEINGELILVPLESDTELSVDTETTITIYWRVKVIGGKDYLKPAPFHAHPAEASEDTDIETQLSSDFIDPLNSGNTNNGEDESNGAGENRNIEPGKRESFAFINGQYHPFTTDPAVPIECTEYMINTWGNGQEKLPQWIELYNPNNAAITLRNYEFLYVLQKKTHSVQLKHFLIPPQKAIILATHTPLQRHRIGGILDSQVYDLGIYNLSKKGSHVVLKKGWCLTDPNGVVVSKEGKVFGERQDPIVPTRVGLSRASYKIYDSERARSNYFFGFRLDVGTPGFHEPEVPRSPILPHRKIATTWASQKMR